MPQGDYEEIENINIFKDRKTFNNFLDQKNSHVLRIEMSIYIIYIIAIRCLVIVMTGLYLIAGTCNYILVNNALANTKNGYELVYKSGRRQSLIQICLFSLIQINQLKNDWLSISNDEVKKKNYFQKQINYLDSYVDKLQQLQNEMLMNGMVY